MANSNLYKMKECVTSIEMKDKIVIYNMETGDCFGIEDIGILIWENINKGYDINEIANNIGKLYDVTKIQLLSDINSFIELMIENNLVIKVK
ncbi:PqqD family protein [Clostridium sp.]|uniref:PqqD family protein n=1 Tax=Clostridium sp. TaxID=1506 RepID=UPI003F3DC673